MTTATRTVEYVRPWLYPAQLDAIFCLERYAIVEASTKSGKTVGCMVWLAEQAMQGGPNKNYWWVAVVNPVSKIAFRRMKHALPVELYTANETEQTITLANGAVMWFKSAEKPDNLYGEDVYAAVIDEASRCREEAWHAVRSTLTATRGPVRIIGNVKGRKNWAYRLARKAEAGESGWHFARITASDAVSAGVLAEEEIREAERDLPEEVFRQLYMAEPADDEGNPFGIEAIRSCIGQMSTATPRNFGIDLAKSQDWTVLHGLDRDGHTARWARFQSPWEETEARIKATVGDALAWADSTGVGDPIVERLQRANPRIQGYKFSQESKQKLMEGLSYAIQRKEITFPDGPIVRELEEFEYQYRPNGGVRYSAPEGLHDDCVMALALAVHGRQRPAWGFV